MNLDQHDVVIRFTLGQFGFGDPARSPIWYGNLAQDTIYATRSKRHFCRTKMVKGKDRDKSAHAAAFLQAKAYLWEERDHVVSRIAAGHYYYAWLALGRAMHTLHDLFAHSNYINLGNRDRAIVCAHLRYHDDREVPEAVKITYWKPFASDKKDEYSHKKHNKDAPGRPGLSEAMDMARFRAYEFLSAIKAEVLDTAGPYNWRRFIGYDTQVMHGPSKPAASAGATAPAAPAAPAASAAPAAPAKPTGPARAKQKQ